MFLFVLKRGFKLSICVNSEQLRVMILMIKHKTCEDMMTKHKTCMCFAMNGGFVLGLNKLILLL